MAVKESSGAKSHSRRKLAEDLARREKVVGITEAQRDKKYQVDYLPRKVIILGIVSVCIFLGWVTGLVSWGVAYVSCGEAPITRRNELMIGTVYYKPGAEGYGLASPIFKSGYVCSDSEEYKRATPPFLR